MGKVWIKGSVASLEVSPIDRHVRPNIEIAYDDGGKSVRIPVDPGRHSCIVSPNVSISDGMLHGCAFVEVDAHDGSIWFDGGRLGDLDGNIAHLGTDILPVLERGDCIDLAAIESTVVDLSISRRDIGKVGASDLLGVDAETFRRLFYREAGNLLRQMALGLDSMSMPLGAGNARRQQAYAQ